MNDHPSHRVPLEYHGPRGEDDDDPEPKPSPWPLFLTGLGAGAVVLIFVTFVKNRFASTNGSLTLMALGIVVPAVICITIPRLLPLGLGLIVSIPLGLLIYFGACLANFRI